MYWIVGHWLLLGLAALLAAMAAGVGVAAVVGVAGAVVAMAVRRAGSHWLKTAVFLSSVAVVVVAGLGVERGGVIVLLFAWLVVVQIVGLGSALAPGENERGAWATMSFYAALVMAFLFISGLPAALPVTARIVAAAAAVVAGLMVWDGFAPLHRFRRSDEGSRVSRRNTASRAGGLAALLTLLALLLWKPLPTVGERLVQAGQGARNTLGEMIEGWSNPADKSGAGVGGGEAGGGAEVPSFDNRKELPERAELVQGSNSLLHLHFPGRDWFDRFLSTRGYVHSGLLERYADHGWEEAAIVGLFRSDEDDGDADGWVRLRTGGGVPHRVYLPAAGGVGLAAIQNPLAYRVDQLIETAPGMFDAELRGAVYYDAESSPKTLAEVSRRVQPGLAPRPHLGAGAEGEFGRKLQLLVAAVTAEAGDPGAQLEAIRRYLRDNCTYSKRIENPDGLRPLDNFLFGERVGWCDFFASAAVLMAREAGFPARLAYGFCGGSAFPDQQLITFRETDAHSWAEVLVEGVGWVVFDTTPEGQGAARPPAVGAAAAPPDLSDFKSIEELDGGEVAQTDPGQGRWRPWMTWGLLGLGLGLVGLVALRIFSRGDDPDAEDADAGGERVAAGAPAYLREFLRLCREIGRPKPSHETLRESISGLVGMGVSGKALVPVASYHYSIRYEDAPRDRAQEAELRSSLRRLRKEMADRGE